MKLNVVQYYLQHFVLSLPCRQWPRVYDLCHTFLDVALVKQHMPMRESHAKLESHAKRVWFSDSEKNHSGFIKTNAAAAKLLHIEPYPATAAAAVPPLAMYSMMCRIPQRSPSTADTIWTSLGSINSVLLFLLQWKRTMLRATMSEAALGPGTVSATAKVACCTSWSGNKHSLALSALPLIFENLPVSATVL